MSYVTIEAEIEDGKIILKEPEKLPAAGKALVTVLGAPEGKPNWDKVMSLLGTMRHPADGMAVEQTARAEWDERERDPRPAT